MLLLLSLQLHSDSRTLTHPHRAQYFIALIEGLLCFFAARHGEFHGRVAARTRLGVVCISRWGDGHLTSENLLGPGSELRDHNVELALEWHHHIAGVLREALDRVERRNNEALGSGEHGHDRELSSTSVVQLHVQAALLLLWGVVLEEVEWVVQVEQEL